MQIKRTKSATTVVPVKLKVSKWYSKSGVSSSNKSNKKGNKKDKANLQS